MKLPNAAMSDNFFSKTSTTMTTTSTSSAQKPTGTDAMLESSKDRKTLCETSKTTKILAVLVSPAFWAKKEPPNESSKMPQKSITIANPKTQTMVFLDSRCPLVFPKR